MTDQEPGVLGRRARERDPRERLRSGAVGRGGGGRPAPPPPRGRPRRRGPGPGRTGRCSRPSRPSTSAPTARCAPPPPHAGAREDPDLRRDPPGPPPPPRRRSATPGAGAGGHGSPRPRAAPAAPAALGLPLVRRPSSRPSRRRGAAGRSWRWRALLRATAESRRGGLDRLAAERELRVVHPSMPGSLLSHWLRVLGAALALGGTKHTGLERVQPEGQHRAAQGVAESRRPEQGSPAGPPRARTSERHRLTVPTPGLPPPPPPPLPTGSGSSSVAARRAGAAAGGPVAAGIPGEPGAHARAAACPWAPAGGGGAGRAAGGRGSAEELLERLGWFGPPPHPHRTPRRGG